MEKEFIPYEQALELKELGFDEPCIACWSNRKSEDYYLYFGGIEYVEDGGYANLMKDTTISAPLYQQAFRWFREKHGLHYNMQVLDGKWFFERWSLDGFKTYEESELACLKKLIEIVKEK